MAETLEQRAEEWYEKQPFRHGQKVWNEAMAADFVRSEMRDVVKGLRENTATWNTRGYNKGAATALETVAQEIECKYNL